MSVGSSEINWEEVDSSNVNRVAWHDGSQTLAVEFNGGSLYTYSGVDHDTYQNLIGSASVGQYMNRVIKALHPYQRVYDMSELVQLFAS